MVKKSLPEEENCDPIFNGLEFYLEIVDKTKTEDFLLENLARGGLIWKILDWSGRIPEIHRCFSCQKKVSSSQDEKYFFLFRKDWFVISAKKIFHFDQEFSKQPQKP